MQTIKENNTVKIVTPQVQLLAYMKPTVAAEALLEPDPDATGMDHLIEAAGRSCYESWHRPNEKTQRNEDYIANILRQKHTSVLEHSYATFYLTGVSRALLAEITRHRQLSFSVRSQRFVDESEAAIVVPPAIRDHVGEVVYGWEGYADQEMSGSATDAIKHAADEASDIYVILVDALMESGLPRKQAREAARAVMPNMTETRIVISGNLRAWREMLVKRLSSGADAEIREVSEMILKRLKEIAPSAMQGIEDEVS